MTTRHVMFIALLVGCSDDTAPPRDVNDSTPDTTDETGDTTPEVDVAPPVGRLVINEIDCRSDPSEWVELMNAGDAPVALEGHRLADRPGGGGVGVPGGVLAPGGYLVVYGDFGIACDRDGVYLSLDGRAIDLAPPRRGDDEVATWGRVPDGSGDFTATAATPHKANRALEDLRATLFPTEGPPPIIDLYVDAASEEILSRPEKVYAPALFQWTDAAGTSPPQRVDVRIKGSITLRPWADKPSLKLHFARHDERGPRAFRGAKKLTLHNLAYDPSAIREWLAYELFRDAGQPAPRVGWVIVRVNGVSKHLYALVESYDEVFLEDWYPSTTALYEADGDLAHGSLVGFTLEEGESMAPLERLAERVLAVYEGSSRPTLTLEDVDWVQLAAMHGLEEVLQHTDGMRSGCHNYFMHVDATGHWTFMPWSVDLTLLEGYGEGGPIGTCSIFAQLCDRDAQCRAWFERARETAAGLVLRGDYRARAIALATRLQPYASPLDEPWGKGDFWGDKTFDLPAQAAAAVDILEARAAKIRCATRAMRADPPSPPADDPTCGGFVGRPGEGGPK